LTCPDLQLLILAKRTSDFKPTPHSGQLNQHHK